MWIVYLRCVFLKLTPLVRGFGLGGGGGVMANVAVEEGRTSAGDAGRDLVRHFFSGILLLYSSPLDFVGGVMVELGWWDGRDLGGVNVQQSFSSTSSVIEGGVT